MDLEVVQYQREAFQRFRKAFDLPPALHDALAHQLETWTALWPGVWFESNSRSYVEHDDLVQFMMYEDPGIDQEAGDEFQILAIWLKDSRRLEEGPIIALNHVYHGDESCSPNGTYVVAENIDEYFALLAAGYLGLGEHEREVQPPAGFSWEAQRPFPSFKAARKHAWETQRRYQELFPELSELFE